MTDSFVKYCSNLKPLKPLGHTMSYAEFKFQVTSQQ